MSILKSEQIKEIAIHVAEGIIVFVHKKTGQIRPMPEPEEEKDNWKETCDQLTADEKQWLKIIKVPFDDELHLRKGFIDDATDNHVKRQLTNALKRNNPMRNFQQVVEGDEILNIHWRNYRKSAYEYWVSNYIIDRYNY